MRSERQTADEESTKPSSAPGLSGPRYVGVGAATGPGGGGWGPSGPALPSWARPSEGKTRSFVRRLAPGAPGAGRAAWWLEHGLRVGRVALLRGPRRPAEAVAASAPRAGAGRRGADARARLSARPGEAAEGRGWEHRAPGSSPGSATAWPRGPGHVTAPSRASVFSPRKRGWRQHLRVVTGTSGAVRRAPGAQKPGGPCPCWRCR